MTTQNLPIAGSDAATMHADRFCEKCSQVCDGGEPDKCLGYIPGVSHACCGHGRAQAYVVIGGTPNQARDSHEHHTTLRGVFASLFFALVRESETQRARSEIEHLLEGSGIAA